MGIGLQLDSQNEVYIRNQTIISLVAGFAACVFLFYFIRKQFS